MKYFLFLTTLLLSTPLCSAQRSVNANGQTPPYEGAGFVCPGVSESEPFPTGKVIELGDVTRKALAMPYPKIANAPSVTERVKAEVFIDLISGKVVRARIVSGTPSLGEAVKKSVCRAAFFPVNDIPPIKGRGFITYTFKGRGGVTPNKRMRRTRGKRVS